MRMSGKLVTKRLLANMCRSRPKARTTISAFGGLVYWPTGIEWMVTLGVIGLACALLCFGLDRICKKKI